VLASATRAFDRARKGSGDLPLRLGYVSWLPPEAAAIPDPRIRIDEWVLPSHTQAGRVAYGSLDLGIAWVEEADIARLNLSAHLLWYESLQAVMPRAHEATRHESVPAAEITVLVDIDEATWSSWEPIRLCLRRGEPSVCDQNQGRGYSRASILRPRGPFGAASASSSPKRHAEPMPPTLTRRPVRPPVPLWGWALLHRADDTRRGCSCHPNLDGPRLDLWLANTSR